MSVNDYDEVVYHEAVTFEEHDWLKEETSADPDAFEEGSRVRVNDSRREDYKWEGAILDFEIHSYMHELEGVMRDPEGELDPFDGLPDKIHWALVEFESRERRWYRLSQLDPVYEEKNE